MLVLVKLCSVFKISGKICIVSGKICIVSGNISRKSDVNKFEKRFVWLLVWLTHIDILVGS